MRAKAAGQRHVTRVVDEVMPVQRRVQHGVSRREAKIGRPTGLERRIVLPGVKLTRYLIDGLIGDSPRPRQCKAVDRIAQRVARFQLVLLALPGERGAGYPPGKRK